MPLPILNEFIELLKNYKNSILIKASQNRKIEDMIAMDASAFTCGKLIETIQHLMKKIADDSTKKVDTTKS